MLRTLIFKPSIFRGLHLTRNINYSISSLKMGDADQDVLMPLRMAVKEQGDEVRKLKEQKADQMTIKAAVQELKKRKNALQDKELEIQAASGPKFDRELFEKSCKQRFIYVASFDMYRKECPKVE